MELVCQPEDLYIVYPRFLLISSLNLGQAPIWLVGFCHLQWSEYQNDVGTLTISSVRLPLGKYLGIAACVWGACLMVHAACINWGGLMAARFFLGVGGTNSLAYTSNCKC